MNSMYIGLFATSIHLLTCFIFDYGDYKLMGSSPEAQLLIQNGKATATSHCGNIQADR